MNSAFGPRYTARGIAKAIGVGDRAVRKRAAIENWPFKHESVRGGQCHSYHLEDIPLEFRAKLLQEEAARAAGEPNLPANPSSRSGYDAEELWKRAASRPANEREKGKARAVAVRRVRILVDKESGCCISLCFDKILQIIPMQGRGVLWISSLLQERVTVASLTETYGSTGPLPGLNSLLQ